MNFLSTILKGMNGILAASSGYIIAGLLALLLASVYLNKHQQSEINDITKKSSEVSLINIQLNKTITDLRQELIDSPKECIQTAKETTNIICETKYNSDTILSFPSNTIKKVKEGNKDETPYVDIDGLLPPEFVRLLK